MASDSVRRTRSKMSSASTKRVDAPTKKSTIRTAALCRVDATRTPPVGSSSSKSLKRKRIHDEEHSNCDEAPSIATVDLKKKKQKQDVEKRLRRYRKRAPKSFLEKLDRARSQRMIVVGRQRTGAGATLQEDIDIVGSTGNIYTVTIGQLPSCTCPDHLNGNECKHKVYALHTVLRAPEDLQYQLAFLADELQQIFSGAPPIPTDVGESEEQDGKRKPVEGECPICYMDFDEENNELVWCKAACGNNMHKSCFDQWAASQRGKVVKCVYCRTDWQMEKGNLRDIQRTGNTNDDGYVNVAERYGMSGERDYSSYNQYWVRRTFG